MYSQIKIYVNISYCILRVFLQVITVTRQCTLQTKIHTSYVLCLHISGPGRHLQGIQSAKICMYQHKNLGITLVTH